jgi:UDP-N-acetylmuramate--alanine ligase
MRIHFVGIGGIGVSALAQYYLATGYSVSGSDLARSEITKLLQKKGVKIFLEKHSEKNLPRNTDLVVYSPAVKKDNPVLKEARKLGIKCQSYPQVLRKLTKKYFTIAVAGTHGKSTTTAMLALVLIKAGLDPTVIVGTKLKEFGNSNFRMGKSKILVIEACEYGASFLNYFPQMIVLTNIEREHLDYFKNLNNILKAFQKFVQHLPKNGMLIVNRDDKNIQKILNKKLQLKTKNYSIKQKEAKKLKKILMVPGEYNIYNALAALTAARAINVPDKISFKALSEFKGVWRRFEIKKVMINGKLSKIISDYAHHPTEIKAALKAAREKFPSKKIWCVFQPHQFQRTFYFFKDFIDVFRMALSKNWVDKLIITDIYDVAGREDKEIRKRVSSEKLAQKINEQQAIYIPTIKKAQEYLRKNLKGREAVIIMGAGDIFKLSEQKALGMDK